MAETYLKRNNTPTGHAQLISSRLYHNLNERYNIDRFDSTTIIAYDGKDVSELTKMGFITVKKPEKIDEDFHKIEGVDRRRSDYW